MSNSTIVDRAQWLEQRLAHLQAEKEFDRQRDELARQRRELPRFRIDKNYVFDSSAGAVSLTELFAGKSQLIAYHFMFHPEWETGGCPSCSYIADHFDGMTAHLAQRDVSFVVVSRASVAQIEAYKKRLGWKFNWVSSGGNTFNRDFHVSFTPEELAGGVNYNYREGVEFPSEEAPGASVFMRDDSGAILHTYSTYARGLDRLIGTYHFLDMTPQGRDEQDLPFSMAWVRRHDEYED